MNIEFGIYLKYLRSVSGISLRTLSDLTGISASHICNVENGTRSPFSSEKLELICNALNLSSNEKKMLFCLSSEGYGIPSDILSYMSKCDSSVQAVSVAKKYNYKNVDWDKIIEYIETKAID